MVIIRCPTCDTNTLFSLIDRSYEGPFRCWKCSGTFVLAIEDEKLKSCKPISEEEFEKYTT